MAIDPDASPAERFAAYLADEEGEPLPRRLPRRECWRDNAAFVLAVAGVLAATAGLIWASGRL